MKNAIKILLSSTELEVKAFEATKLHKIPTKGCKLSKCLLKLPANTNIFYKHKDTLQKNTQKYSTCQNQELGKSHKYGDFDNIHNCLFYLPINYQKQKSHAT